MHTTRTRLIATTALTLAGLLAACATTDPYPSTDANGLTRQASKDFDALYLAADANAGQYKQIKLTVPSVEFRPHWQRDQNASRSVSTDRVTDEVVEEVRKGAAESLLIEFGRQFERAGYTLTDDAGPDVLQLEPAIVDLDVAAPDTSRYSSSVSTTYTKSKGKATLDLKMVDSTTGKVIGHVIDEKEDTDSGMFWMANSVSNRAEANRAMRDWADDIVAVLKAGN
ncbi:DUF3313 domain-containing protein [Marinihelvus fidelis]|uniref:DUF3313 domain-containing protein n=1 Tax=Marinihelvus fidelis TaxID=2613842 RepID=A0A5N0TG57_9GAMM|nr:DUF3313 family protein [Marinihelvus fidelis]KAA9134020.1 DUF3313 domain-containing protein [Marinihelvus fidelis]